MLIASEEIALRQRRRLDPILKPRELGAGRCAGGYADLRDRLRAATPRARSTRRSSARPPTASPDVHLTNPAARHCLAVAVMSPAADRLRRAGRLVLRRHVRRRRDRRRRQLRLERGREPDVRLDRRARQRRQLGRRHDPRRARSSSRATPAPAPASPMKGGTRGGGRLGRLHVRLHDAARQHDRVRRRRRRHRRLDVRGHRLRAAAASPRWAPTASRPSCSSEDLALLAASWSAHGIDCAATVGSEAGGRPQAVELLQARVRRLEGAL